MTLLAIGIIFGTLIINNNYNFSDDQVTGDKNIEIINEILEVPPKKSITYQKTFIHVDETNNNLNWSYTAANNDWCYYKDGRYIIENVTLTASGSGSGILIENSKNVYFTIRNCNVTSTGTTAYDAGIELDNTNNGTLTNNICFDNGRLGILLANDCDNNTIMRNTAINIVGTSQDFGILLYQYCDNNTISGNTANNNQIWGIRLEKWCHNNTITGNSGSNVGNSVQDYGIGCYFDCDDNTFSENAANCNTIHGIFISEDCDDNIFTENNANNNIAHGFAMRVDCYRNTFMGNTICDNNNWGIRFWTRCDDNIISGNIIGNNMTKNQPKGINFNIDCNDNNITDNIIYYNNETGIFLSGSCFNNLVHSNYFIGNREHARDDFGNNQWDNGIIGNYWDNYTGQDILPMDGIGDTPHPLPINMFDNKPMMYNYEDTDGDSFTDVDEEDYGTNPLNPMWYPMPNLNVSHFSSVVTSTSTSFMIDFSIRNNGIWKAEGVIVIVRCEELGLTLFNNTDSPFNIDVDDTLYINTNCAPIGQTGTFTLNITVDPNNLIAETYSAKDGSLRSDWEGDNSQQASLSIISTSSQVITIVGGDDDDGDGDDDDDELVSTSIYTATIVIAVIGGVIATAIILHAKLMIKRLAPETPITSEKIKPIKKKNPKS